MTTHWAGILAIAIFIAAYILVILEENIHLRKSKPVIVAAGFIWMLVAFADSEFSGLPPTCAPPLNKDDSRLRE